MTSGATLLDARDKVLLVFGAAGGIGGALVRTYHSAGGSVLAADRMAVEESSGITYCACDATREDSVAAAVAAALHQFGRIDAVAHAVGIALPGPLQHTTLADWEQVMNVNLTSAFLVTRASYAALKDSRGSMVLIASSSARNGGSTSTGPAYAASKAGMLNLVRYLAKEWAPDHIRVNAVAPGPVKTPMMEGAGTERMSQYAKATLTGKLAMPEEVAAAAAFLFSEHATSMTGTVLNASAGIFLD